MSCIVKETGNPVLDISVRSLGQLSVSPHPLQFNADVMLGLPFGHFEAPEKQI